MKSSVRVMVFVAMVLVTIMAAGQSSVNSETQLYIDINKVNKKTVSDIKDEVLGLQYMDAYGQLKSIRLKVYDWKRTQAAELELAKSRGQNHYRLNLNQILPGREKDVIYTLSFVDEAGKEYKILVRFIDLKKTSEVTCNITVNPKYIHCDDELEGSLIEFLGNTSKGKAPYTVSWYVLNDSRTKFLFQPREQILERPGLTPSIMVDKQPDYYVIMTVKDSCGGEEHQVVHVVCENGQKRINTVFFESVQEMTNTKNIQ
ncbi:hypothetical protein WBG78_26625 [Chryseolinea sp. T2]|uniref:hypothetical protein n=1 Tax=Chryseolinea sp. T2 TaxID=3129255 RepID=UPI0030785394